VLRTPAERANALLQAKLVALRRVALALWRPTAITAAALVLLNLGRAATQ
jgi:hypothetical protein